MPKVEWKLGDFGKRLLTLALYFCLAFGFLFYYSGISFCETRTDKINASFRLAVGCTGWFWLASSASRLVVRLSKKPRFFAVILCSLLSLAGFASLPRCVFEGYGQYRFEHTVADVSCFFVESSGMVFPYIAAPVLALLVFLCETIMFRINRPHTSSS